MVTLVVVVFLIVNGSRFQSPSLFVRTKVGSLQPERLEKVIHHLFSPSRKNSLLLFVVTYLTETFHECRTTDLEEAVATLMHHLSR